MEIVPEAFDSEAAAALVAAQIAELGGVYDGVGDVGPVRESSHFEPPHGVFLVGRVDGRPLACGGICRFDDARAEVKRMYVAPEARGRGLGRRVLEELESAARGLGYRGIVLETGVKQREALGLYRSTGYEPIPCYGPYAGEERSRCFEKRL